MVELLDLVKRHGIEPRRASNTHGGEYHSPCPDCGGNDRFHVWPEQNPSEDGTTRGTYWCRQCGKVGDTIQFLIDFEGLSFPEACAKVGRGTHRGRSLDRPRMPKKRIWQPKDHETPGERWQEKARKFVIWAFENLIDSEEMLKWLRVERGIREDAAGRYGLGWNCGDKGKDLYRSRESWGLPRLLNEKTGRARPLWLPRGMVLPCFFEDRISKIKIRRPDPLEFGPRYYMVPGSSSVSMVLEPERQAHVVVEAELDAILVAQEAGDLASVVALGSAQTRPDLNTVEALRHSLQILVALDFDRAGAKEWQWWSRSFLNCERWPVPRGKDPAEAYKAGVNIRDWVKAGLPPVMKV